MNSLIYVPGQWVCDVCQFVLHKRLLHGQTGGVFLNIEVTDEYCPNDRHFLRRYTWKELAESQEATICELLKERKGN